MALPAAGDASEAGAERALWRAQTEQAARRVPRCAARRHVSSEAVLALALLLAVRSRTICARTVSVHFRPACIPHALPYAVPISTLTIAVCDRYAHSRVVQKCQRDTDAAVAAGVADAIAAGSGSSVKVGSGSGLEHEESEGDRSSGGDGGLAELEQELVQARIRVATAAHELALVQAMGIEGR